MKYDCKMQLPGKVGFGYLEKSTLPENMTNCGNLWREPEMVEITRTFTWVLQEYESLH